MLLSYFMQKSTTSARYRVGTYALSVRRSKTGKGLFAGERIPKGACIIEYIGTAVSKAQAERMSGKYLFEVARGRTIDGNIPANKARFINHSCKPNCEADGPPGRVFILALRTITEGEELTYDYGEEYFEEHIQPVGCRCSSCAVQ